jgi:prepilin-type N-terminal cleavage/methylation domain-containing protein
MRARLGAFVRDERGYSLIELLTALSILLTVMGSLTILMVSATKSEVDLTQRVQAQQEARLALERIRHEIHRACVAEHMTLATGAVDTTAGAKTNVRLTPPDASLADPCLSTARVTWCMQQVAGSTNRWRVRRVVGTPTSCTGGRPEADYITTSAVFTLQPAASGSLMKLNVNFPVDVDPTDGKRAYRLEDSLVLRNSERAA